VQFDAHDGVVSAAAPGEFEAASRFAVRQGVAAGIAVGRADHVPAPGVKAAGVAVDVGMVNDHVAGCFRYRY